jgi:serine/threonine-protein kinase
MTAACPRCGSRQDRLDVCPVCMLQPERVIAGVLEVEGEIGRGGMGTVLKARHLKLGRTVAVKLLPAEVANEPEFKGRFEREARALALLNHPNIVSIHDFGQDGEQPYIVMEFVEGGSLADRLPLPLSAALDVALQVCDALSYAHGRGVVHRDIKPDNILLDERGRVKVTDFGIARLLKSDSRITRTDEVVGTPHYMAPESLDGARPDPRMDVFSAGVLVYQMITGKVPRGDFEPLQGGLDPIVRKALAPEPSHRYRSIDEFRDALLTVSRLPQPSELPPDERIWIRAVAMLQSISTAVALWAFVVSVTPRVIASSDVLPLILLYRRTMPDGSIFTLARFEMWWTMAALATFGIAITAYGFLRRHWRQSGLETREPDRAVPESRRVVAFGILSILVYGVRLLLESRGHDWAAAYAPIVGGVILVLALFYLWVSILSAWRISRPLRREFWLWFGFGTALVPPVVQLSMDIYTQWP